MAIDTTANAHKLRVHLPYEVTSGEWILSTEEAVCRRSDIEMTEPAKVVMLDLPARSINTYIFKINRVESGVDEIKSDCEMKPVDDALYDMQGRRMNSGASLRQGIYIKNGKKIYIK